MLTPAKIFAAEPLPLADLLREVAVLVEQRNRLFAENLALREENEQLSAKLTQEEQWRRDIAHLTLDVCNRLRRQEAALAAARGSSVEADMAHHAG